MTLADHLTVDMASSQSPVLGSIHVFERLVADGTLWPVRVVGAALGGSGENASCSFFTTRLAQRVPPWGCT